VLVERPGRHLATASRGYAEDPTEGPTICDARIEQGRTSILDERRSVNRRYCHRERARTRAGWIFARRKWQAWRSPAAAADRGGIDLELDPWAQRWVDEEISQDMVVASPASPSSYRRCKAVDLKQTIVESTREDVRDIVSRDAWRGQCRRRGQEGRPRDDPEDDQERSQRTAHGDLLSKWARADGGDATAVWAIRRHLQRPSPAILGGLPKQQVSKKSPETVAGG
jgi:hypothetical protein